LGYIAGTVERAFKPSLYEILPSRAQRAIDIIEAIWSYLVTLIALVYMISFVLVSKHIEWSVFNIEKGVIYFGTLFLFISIALASIANGNKAIQRLRGK